MKSTLLTLFCLLSALLPLHAGAQEPADPGQASVYETERVRQSLQIREDIDAYAGVLAGAGELSGTLLVALGGRVIYERAFGMASYELGTANTIATRHGIASVSKLLTAALALKLAEQGVIGLDDPLAEYLPDFPRAAEITVDHLLRHRSGIPHRVTADGDVSTPRTATDMAGLAGEAELLFEPGSRRGYSSAGYSVLARVLEVASGVSYAELLDTEIFAPASALHAATDDGWRLVSGRSDDHLMGAHGPVPAPPADLSFLVGAGSVFATPRDLLAVMVAIDEGRYGDLARREILGEEGEVGWNGQSFGYRAFLDYRSGDGRAVIFAGNLHTGANDLLRRDVPRIVAGEGVESPAVPAPPSASLSVGTRADIAGVYQFRAGQPDSEEALRFAPDGSFGRLGSWSLVPVAEDSFASTTDYATVAILRADDGSVSGLEWRRGDDSFVLPRVRGLP